MEVGRATSRSFYTCSLFVTIIWPAALTPWFYRHDDVRSKHICDASFSRPTRSLRYYCGIQTIIKHLFACAEFSTTLNRSRPLVTGAECPWSALNVSRAYLRRTYGTTCLLNWQGTKTFRIFMAVWQAPTQFRSWPQHRPIPRLCAASRCSSSLVWAGVVGRR